jgi:hypothetical protein
MATQPSLKPIGTLFGDTWKLYKKHMNALALVGVIPLIFYGAKIILQPGFIASWGYPLWLILVLLTAAAIFALLHLVFSIILPLALVEAVDEAHKGKIVETSAVYKRAFAETIQYLFVLMLVIIVFLGGSVLFIIPGIVAAIYLKFAIFTYLCEDKRGMDALVTSAWYVKGSWWAILGRQILLAIVLAVAAFIFIIIVGAAVIALGFSPAIFSILFQLFVFMILIPYGMTYVYMVYKDAKSLKEGKEPHKDFVNESEQLFIVLLIVATVAVLIVFCVSTFGRWDVRFSGMGTITSRRANSGYMMNRGNYNSGTMMYGRQSGY